MAWTWRFEKADGTEVQPAVQPEEFTTQGDAESWIGEYWKELLEGGADQVPLFEDSDGDLRPDEPARRQELGPVPTRRCTGPRVPLRSAPGAARRDCPPWRCPPAGHDARPSVTSRGLRCVARRAGIRHRDLLARLVARPAPRTAR